MVYPAASCLPANTLVYTVMSLSASLCAFLQVQDCGVCERETEYHSRLRKCQRVRAKTYLGDELKID